MKNYIFAILLIWLLFSNIQAVPNLINFQGALKDQNGEEVNRYVDITFKIYESETGGTPIWQETHNGVYIENGLFNVELGSVVALPPDIFQNDNLWITFRVSGDTVDMVPRNRLKTVPYAFVSESANHSVKSDTTTTVSGVGLSGLVQQDSLGNVNVSGTVNANAFVGDGSGLTGITSIYDNNYINTNKRDTMSVLAVNKSILTIVNQLLDSYAKELELYGNQGIYAWTTYDIFYPYYSHGLYAKNFDYGVYIDSVYTGVYVNSWDSVGEWGFYTPDKIYASNITSKSVCNIGKYVGNQSIGTGDIVSLVGYSDSEIEEENDKIAVVKVEKTNYSNRKSVFGVVNYKLKLTNNRLNKKQVSKEKLFIYDEGEISTGDYISIVVLGPADVNIRTKEHIKSGDVLVFGKNGVEKSKSTIVNGVEIAENVGIIGKSIQDYQSGNKIKIYINCK